MTNQQLVAMEQALEALESCSGAPHWSALQPALTALREALAQQPAQTATYTCGVCGVSMQMEQPAQQEPSEADELLRKLGLDPEQYRTDGGVINHMKLRAAIQHPEEYPAHSSLKLKWCHVCGLPNPEEGVCNHGVEQPAQQQEPVVWMYVNKSTHETKFQKHMRDFVDHSLWSEVPLYGEPLANHELQCVCGAVWMGDEMVHLPDKRPPASKPWVGLTEQEHTDIAIQCGCMSADWVFYGATVERILKEKNS